MAIDPLVRALGNLRQQWQLVVTCAFVLPFLTLVGWWVLSYFRSPLRRYPGPLLAGWTNLWRLFAVQSGCYPSLIRKLHDRYGPILRIGPNLLDLDYPELINTIYGTDDKWLKTEFYHNQSTVVDGKIVYSIFSTSDPSEHARMKRPVAKHFSVGSFAAMEPHMDEAIDNLCYQLEHRFIDKEGRAKSFDLGEWISYCAWDLVTAITFSRPYGYMEKGFDFDNTLSDLDKSIDYFTAVGQMPFLDFFLDKNPIFRLGPPTWSKAAEIALRTIVSRQKGEDKAYDPQVPDLLHHFMETKFSHPDAVDDATLLGYCFIPLVAGADTTAIIIRAVFYFTLRNPDIYRKLQDELLSAGFGAEKPAPYNAARALPYLEAVIREAMRLHPSIPMPMERYVPSAGLRLPDGSYVPPNVAVGIGPYTIGRNRNLWGPDADVFRPERWLQALGESSAAYQERLRAMKAADLVFGAGSRICLGRHLALIEIYKMVATLASRFEIELTDRSREWTVVGSWFFRQTGIICNFKRRGPTA
ncbi:cytochrome P450 [Thozetella sp. PMI_491]|nr:cytochrome P450 [Thozetella sp. PMI_491]